MKRSYLTIIAIVIVVFAAIGIYSMSGKSSSPQSSTMQKEKARMEEKGDSVTDASSPRYIEYSKSALESQSTNRRILYFYANWCPICKPADENFRTNQNLIPVDVTVIRVNYNDSDTDQEEKDLAKKYAVTYQHTFVQIDQDGNDITKWNGGKIDELLKNII